MTVLGCDDLSKHHEIRGKIGFVIEKAGFPSALSAKDMNSILKDTYQNWNESYYFEILNRLEGDTDRKFNLPVTYHLGPFTVILFTIFLTFLNSSD